MTRRSYMMHGYVQVVRSLLESKLKTLSIPIDPPSFYPTYTMGQNVFSMVEKILVADCINLYHETMRQTVDPCKL